MRTLHKIIAATALALLVATGVALGPRFWQGADAGVVTAYTTNRTDPATRSAQIARLARDPDVAPELVELLQGLQQDLQAQREAHEQLAAQLAEFNHERLAAAGFAATETVADPEATATIDEGETNEGEATAQERFRGRRGAVTEDRLVAAGFAAAQARDIVSRADALAMERLNMQYQAAREGWLDTDQYREAVADLSDVREIVTAEYGDDAYDRYLYAAGRANRLVVRDVIQDSPAGVAGLQPGDRVLAMADERIYSTRDLMNIASAGRAGETVPLVVERGDAVFELYVPRGPLGIRGGRGFENPSSP